MLGFGVKILLGSYKSVVADTAEERKWIITKLVPSPSTRYYRSVARSGRWRESKRHLFVVVSLDKHMQKEKELIRLRRFMPAARATRARSAQFCGCCCSSYWAGMSTPLLGAWVLVNAKAKALGPQEGTAGNWNWGFWFLLFCHSAPQDFG